ncbi:MAG: EAL domain-containing protein [Candidatus Eremiobacteraeota bacterium]|nr:EAL domain-containing protein [Candidatus Eremiobacteraeota bacterium]
MIAFAVVLVLAVGAAALWAARLTAAVRAARRRAAEEIERHFDILETVGDGIYVLDGDLRITHVNEEAERLLRTTADALVGRALDTVVDPLASELVPEIRAAQRSGSVVERTCAFGATQTWIELRIKPAANETLVSLRDVSERTRAQVRMRENDQRLRLVTSDVDAVLWTTDRAARFTTVTGGALGDLGLNAERLIDQPCDALVAEHLLAGVFAGTPLRSESARGERWLRHHVEPLRDVDGAVIGAVGVSLDITEMKRAQQRLLDAAHLDRLTGLPNRLALERLIADTITAAERDRGRFALLFVDVDRFKTINDTLGHGVGDDVLREIAVRLRETLRADDVIARPGGDEFIVLIPRVQRESELEMVALRLMRALTQPVGARGRELFVSASVGAALYPDHGADGEALVAHADAAMYRAKASGGNRFAIFDDAMEAAAAERLTLENDLRHAIQRDELRLLFQPVVDVATQRLVGCEALLRWNHRERGAIPPSVFVPIAEETGAIVALDRWVLREACAALARIRVLQPDFRMAVNFAARDLREPDLRDVVAALLHEHDLPASALAIEVSEHAALDDTAIPALTGLCALGVHVVVDDFGIGYSSLACLKRLPITGLKIDREFVRDITEDPHDQAIVGSIVAIAKALGLHVTAEGIETDEQFAHLAAAGCHAAQGYRFGRPVPYERIEARAAARLPILYAPELYTTMTDGR